MAHDQRLVRLQQTAEQQVGAAHVHGEKQPRLDGVHALHVLRR